MLQNHPLFSVAGIFKFQSFSKFDGYDTILLGIFPVLCIRSLGSIYYMLQACTLKQHVLSLQPHRLVTTIFFKGLQLFYYECTLNTMKSTLIY